MMTMEEFRKKLDEDEAFRAEVEAKAKSLEEQYPDKSDSEREAWQRNLENCEAKKEILRKII